MIVSIVTDLKKKRYEVPHIRAHCDIREGSSRRAIGGSAKRHPFGPVGVLLACDVRRRDVVMP